MERASANQGKQEYKKSIDLVFSWRLEDVFNEELYKDKEEDRVRDALTFANACVALTVMERGAIPALPSRETVLNDLLKFA